MYHKHWNKRSGIIDSCFFFFLLHYTSNCWLLHKCRDISCVTARRGLAPSSSSLTKNTICLICIIHLIHAQMLSSGVPSVTMWAHNSARTATRGFALRVNIWVLSRAQISFFFFSFLSENRNVQFQKETSYLELSAQWRVDLLISIQGRKQKTKRSQRVDTHPPIYCTCVHKTALLIFHSNAQLNSVWFAHDSNRIKMAILISLIRVSQLVMSDQWPTK